MFELVESETISACISRAPGQTENYAKVMADLAREIHSIEASEDDSFPEAAERIREYIRGGIAHVDEALAEKCMKLVDELPASDNLVHGDFHTGNVFMQNGEPLLIDMDRISRGDPIIEISDLYYFYVMLGENDASVVEKFMGFPYEDAKLFLIHSLNIILEQMTRKSWARQLKRLLSFAVSV
ncbi:MAG: phosphotransferase [Ruminococcus sp.]|nr:phosphotransferase [Ruminococcus sp.]